MCVNLFRRKLGKKKSCYACFCFSFFLALIKYIRPVFVSRSDQDSRRKTVEEIKRRAQSGKWPQVLYSTAVCQVTFDIVMLLDMQDALGVFLGVDFPLLWNIKDNFLIYTEQLLSNFSL